MKARPFTQRQKDILALYQPEVGGNILRLVPLRYEYYEASDEHLLQVGELCVLEGTITSSIQTVRYKGKQSVSRFTFSTETNDYKVSIFNRPWLKISQESMLVIVRGRYEGQQRITAQQVIFSSLQSQPQVVPIYSLKEGVKQKDLRSIMLKAYELDHHLLKDEIPSELKAKYRLTSHAHAMRMLHFPKNRQEVVLATRTFKYQEFLRYMTGVLLRKARGYGQKEHPYMIDRHKIIDFIKSLPFELTVDQEFVVQEILDDLTSTQKMTRLLQGDVGSGKTAVAAIVAYGAVLGGQQVAILAPTELLAQQHLASFKKFFAHTSVRIGGLYASLPQKTQKEVLEACSHGTLDILVGTHSIFQQRVHFVRLGFVIVDEQHRFGVNQRKQLVSKGNQVDLLMMSATPIPRTLAATLFADMDVSTIETMPAGRKKIMTYLIQENSIRSFEDQLDQLIQQGHQMYVVCPTIIESDALNVRSVDKIARSLKLAKGDVWTVKAIHGQMKSDEKEAIMSEFAVGSVDVLVSTTVIEVGVDVKNSNIMVIYDADRFGLLQLHQLRGRIGRNDQQAHCYLLSNQTDELSKKRLMTLVESDDGFHIATQDLALRGPGDLLGVKQSGLPQFMMGDIVNDQHILMVAKEDALKLISSLNEEDIHYIEWVLKQENDEPFFDV